MKSGGPADAKLQFVQKINNSISNALLAYHTYDFLLKPCETHLPSGLRPRKVQRSSGLIEGKAEDLRRVIVLRVDKLIAGGDSQMPYARNGFGSACDGERAIRIDAVRG